MLETLNLICGVVAWIQVYMLEIYQDSLIDLLLPKNAGKPRKLEIKKDLKVRVTQFFQVHVDLYSRLLSLLMTYFISMLNIPRQR